MTLIPFEHSSETEINLKEHRFFHGLDNSLDLLQIKREGFRSEYVDNDGRWFRDGNLGVGIYLSCNWKTALWFGRTLLQVTLTQGTRIFDASPEPDSDVLRSLERRFGKHITEVVDFRKEIPSNKSIQFKEFAELFRHHYHHLWPKIIDQWRDNSDWPQSRLHHAHAIRACVAHLRRSGYHGYGHPADDNGIVIFQPERIILERVVANVKLEHHYNLTSDENLKMLSLDKLAFYSEPLIPPS